MEDITKDRSNSDSKIDELLDLIEKEIFERQIENAQVRNGSILIDLSTQFRLPGPAESETHRQLMQQAITAYCQSDDVVFHAYIGSLPGVDTNARYPALTPLRLIVPFVADVDLRNGIREQHQMLATFSKRLWDLRKNPLALIRRYNVIDRKKTSLNTFRVRLSKTLEIPQEQEADLYVIGLHGNGAYSHHILGNTLSVATHLIKTEKAPVSAIEIFCFDYRGSVASPGTHEGLDDLADQAVDQVFDLLSQGIPAEKIVLHGHSLGGLVGVIAANKLMKQGHIIHYFGDRPPNSVADFAAAAAGSFFRILSGPARFFSNSLFSAYQCDGSALYLELPHTHRACLASRKDEVVLFEASLVANLRTRHKIDEGIIVEDMYHITPMGNLGLYGDNYNLDENPFFQFLLQRVRPNQQVVTEVLTERIEGCLF